MSGSHRGRGRATGGTQSASPKQSKPPPRPEGTARVVALDALDRIDSHGAFANLVLGSALDASTLDARDRSLVTELVYGTTRMRRACDWLIDRFLLDDIEPYVRNVLRMGAYQLTYMRVPEHAAVSATVDVAPARARGLVNAVLRKVAAYPVDDLASPAEGGWPDVATRLSYPDWIVERLELELGIDTAHAVLTAMNEPATVHERADGYIQDLASQAVANAVDVQPGQLVIDLCAAPGGKATALAGRGARVIAMDRAPKRAGLITTNARRLDIEDELSVIIADGRAVPFAPKSADAVLVDAPCSGLGSLRRRADARWRMGPEDVVRLTALQRDLIVIAADLVRPGGQLVYSVCTLLDAETTEIDDHLRSVRPDLIAVAPGSPFSPKGRGGMLLPSTHGSDGMACFTYRVPT